MDKTIKQLIAILLILILILTAAVLVYRSSNFCYVANEIPSEELPPERETVDTLNVTYWNPWGGPVEGGDVHNSFPAFTLSDYITKSTVIVSVTVTESIKWDNSTEEGQEKLKELDSPWLYPFATECYFEVNEVLKGDFDIRQIYLKTDMQTPAFEKGEEYILFINRPDGYKSTYYFQEPYGYLVKNNSLWEGNMDGNISVTYDDLKLFISVSDNSELYEKMISASDVFAGKMMTSTQYDRLEYVSGIDSRQTHKVQVIGSIKGSLSGNVSFNYLGPCLTEQMIQNNVSADDYRLDRLDSYSTVYYDPLRWSPGYSPLRAGNFYFICLSENNDGYYMRSSNTDFHIIYETDMKKIEQTAENYRTAFEIMKAHPEYGF